MTRKAIAAWSVSIAAALHAEISVLMNRYDPATTGANTREAILNTTNVAPATFGKLYSYYVDGSVYAQPLYVPGLDMPGRGRHNVLFVATMNDKVYAFDADRAGPPLWMRCLTDEMAGITAVPVTDVTNNNDLNVVGNVGIMGTPVIDPVSSALFLVARTKESGRYVQRLYKMDLGTGKDVIAPAVIEASVESMARDASGGVLRFDPKGGNQRPALVLVDGNVIVAWASHEDIRPYHGWIMAYSAADLKQTGVFCVSPRGTEGGIWQSGRGPAVGPDGAIYFETGNGSWDGTHDFGSSLIRLSLRNHRLAVEDFFTPHNYESLNQRDVDLGSTGPMLIPGTNLLVGGSKLGIIYLFDTRHLGHLTAEDSGIQQALPVNGGRVLAGPALWNGPDGVNLYIWCEADFLKAFRFNGSSLEPTPIAKGKVASKGSPGGALTVSSNGKVGESGIVWSTLTVNRSADHGNAAGVLRAFHAGTLEELWNSEQQPKRDRLGTLVKFVPPTVVAGRVYVPNYDNAVQVYGVLR
jgi:hypothetical protein